MAYEGLRRFLALVPEVPVAEAQAQANMGDEEIEELMLLCTEILDSEKSNSLYDLSLLKRLDAMEHEVTERMEQLSCDVDRLSDLAVRLGNAVVEMCMIAERYSAS
jgi:hypothetical protein